MGAPELFTPQVFLKKERRLAYDERSVPFYCYGIHCPEYPRVVFLSDGGQCWRMLQKRDVHPCTFYYCMKHTYLNFYEQWGSQSLVKSLPSSWEKEKHLFYWSRLREKDEVAKNYWSFNPAQIEHFLNTTEEIFTQSLIEHRLNIDLKIGKISDMQKYAKEVN